MTIEQDRWAETVLLAQQKNSAALLLLLEEFDNLIQGACHRFYVPPHERGDLLQEAYVGFLKAVYSFDPAQGTRFAHYAQVQTQAAVWQYMRVRGRNRQREMSAHAELGDGDGETTTALELFADPQAEMEFTGDEWRTWLASLSEREVTVIEHVVIDGMTMADLARMENVSPGTVKTWKQRAFAKIRAEWNKTRD